jgi:hypothetical protein
LDKLHRKPIGEDGPVRIQNADGHVRAEWRKIEHPLEKREQEIGIASAFTEALNANDNSRWSLVSLDEDDFDFELRAGESWRYLELQEIVIPGKKRGSPYASGEQVIHSGKFANTIVERIRAKALRYPRQMARPLDLLVYTTHWRFRPNDVVLKLIAHELSNLEHPFAKIYFFYRLDAPSGTVTTLCPNTELAKGFNRQQAKETRYMNFDPAQFQLVEEDGNVQLKYQLSADAIKKLGLGASGHNRLR